MTSFRNPVLSGQNPDPSVCAVGAEFYLVTSSFAYFPAIPVHRSRDLVHWEPLGHVLDRPEQIDLSGLEVGLGIWAPTIRHHDGVFYVVSTVARGPLGSINFITTASDPAGPWGQPVVLDAEGIDPSLFFDDDGRCWFTACRDTDDPASPGPADLYARELDLTTLQLIGPVHVLWHGALTGMWAEAPHLYKKNGVYHLVAAEGGTERNHAVMAARGDAVTGPFRTDPRSPLLTHRHLGESAPIQNIGHADLVETPAGETWAVVLGTRPLAGHHTLGREVFLVPAEWTDAGLLLAPGRGTVSEVERRPAGLEEEPPRGHNRTRESFDGPDLPVSWRGLRGPVPGAVTGAGLQLPLSVESLSGTGTPSFLARRQEHQRFEARTAVSITSRGIGGRAGLVVFQNQQRFAVLSVTMDGKGQRIATLERAHEQGDAGARVAIGIEPEVLLRVVGDATEYAFSYWDPTTDRWLQVGSVDRQWLSTESAGGFTGVNLGVYAGAPASGAGKAVFSWFDYAPLPDPVASIDNDAAADQEPAMMR